MRFQTSLLSLFLLALVLAPYVDASAKKKNKNKKGKNKNVLTLSDNPKSKPTSPLVDTTNTAPAVQPRDYGTLIQVVPEGRRGGAVTLPIPFILKPKPKPVFALVDTTNTAPAVQLKDQSILVQSVHEESQVSEKDEQTRRFEELINKGQYEGIAKLGKDMSDKELLECLCQVVTKLDHFRGLYEYLKQRGMVPGFLAHGDMVLAKEVIIGTGLLETNKFTGRCDGIYDAIALSFKEDRHERVASLFEAAKEGPDWKHKFDLFVEFFFEKNPPEKNSMPLKRFFTIHGEGFNKKYPAIFETICEKLVRKLKWDLNSPASQKLLIDFVGQPSLLTPVVYAGEFLRFATVDTFQVNFIKYGYKEAIEEGLKGNYLGGRGFLWRVMVSTFPDQFSGEYPSTDEARSIALKDVPTKQDREEAWIKEHTPILVARLDQLMPGLFPKVMWNLIFEYEPIPITWIVV